MNDRSDMIIKYFNFLIKDYGFKIEQKEYDPQTMGNAIVVFESPFIGIEIVIDRGQVLITLGDKNEPRSKWYEFSDVLRYFSSSEKAYIFYEKTEELTWDDAIRSQLDRLATILQQYCKAILLGDLSMGPTIKELERKRVNEMLKKLDNPS